MNDIEYLRKYLKDKDLDTALKELESGIPVQYIVGNTNFYGYDFKVNRNTLIPRFETELLVEKTYNYIKKYFNKDNIKILDIGTGSGCIAITLNKLLNSCDITGIDISSEALEVAKENNISNNTNVKFIESDIFSNVSDKYDVIISNPPYIRKDEEIDNMVYENEPHLALYAEEDGLYFYHQILKSASRYVKSKFLIAFEIGLNQGDEIIKMANRYLDNVNVIVEKDYSDRERFVFIYRD